ncbi:MAG: class I SAM-dependent methyltransferase [Candidatus Woesearchaeota archaeon]
MTRCIRVLKQEAQEAKKYLLDNAMLNHEFRVVKDKEHIYFPVLKSYEGKWETCECDAKKSVREELVVIPFKDALAKILTNEELALAKTAYDVVGTIAIIEVPDELLSKDVKIATALLNSHPYIKTVLRKDGIHQGVFRSQSMKFLAGIDTRIAEYKENNCRLRVDVQDVYFSARLSTERKRIAQQVKKNEEILVMFSGVAPYPCVFAKKTPAQHIVGIEINPRGHELGLENIQLNKVSDKVELFCGDVKKVVPTLNQKFDRIVMPLPKTAQEFLDVALQVAKPNAMIHLYAFYHEDDFDKAKKEIKKYCEQARRSYTIKEIVKAGQHAPRTYRICVDIELTN